MEVVEVKKTIIALSIAAVLFLGGCSLLEGVNNTVTYVTKATDYANNVDTFVREVPALAKQAVGNEQTLLELETKLKDMKDEMGTFNELQAPEIATDLHQQVIDHNQKAKEGIDLLLSEIKDGKLDPAALENIEIFQPLQGISDAIKQIKQLGQ
jgi:hypothetical protein